MKLEKAEPSMLGRAKKVGPSINPNAVPPPASLPCMLAVHEPTALPPSPSADMLSRLCCPSEAQQKAPNDPNVLSGNNENNTHSVTNVFVLNR